MDTPKDDQNFWNFWLLIFSLVVLGVELWILAVLGKVPTEISLFDVVLVMLATFRLTRLFVYDTIMQFLRDLFLKREVSYTPETGLVITRSKYQSGVRRAISDMFSCPWCTGMQLAIVVVFFYYLSAYAWIIILMFAVAGVATLLQLIANAIGWRAENLKRTTEAMNPHETDTSRSPHSGSCG